MTKSELEMLQIALEYAQKHLGAENVRLVASPDGRKRIFNSENVPIATVIASSLCWFGHSAERAREYLKENGIGDGEATLNGLSEAHLQRILSAQALVRNAKLNAEADVGRKVSHTNSANARKSRYDEFDRLVLLPSIDAARAEQQKIGIKSVLGAARALPGVTIRERGRKLEFTFADGTPPIPLSRVQLIKRISNRKNPSL